MKVNEVEDGQQFRTYFASAADDEERNRMYGRCERPIVYSRHHWLSYEGEYRVRADLRAVYETAMAKPPADWTDSEADFLLTLYCLDLAGIGLDEFRDRVDSGMMRDVLDARFSSYREVSEVTGTPQGLIGLARQVSELRTIVERSHYVYSIIDGGAWYREEGLLDRAAVDPCKPSDPVAELLSGCGISLRPDTRDSLRAAARACLAKQEDCAELVRGVMDAALVDPVLRGDHVTLTCPRGNLLGTPELMTTSEAFFTETHLSEELDLNWYHERLGHESPAQLQRTVRARMLKLKRGAIRSLHGPGCLHGQFVEKHGGHMIFRNEDAHYRGHQSIGCSSGGRVSFALRYTCGGEGRELSPMVGDFRVVRMSHDPADIFSGADLARLIPYGEWIRAVVEESYRHGKPLPVVSAPGT
jgi:hypothetical protein